MRYFLETAYDGTNYGGFQIQDNSITIQGEIEKVLEKFYRQKINLTGSSRTDAGVHALQNFFHFDTDIIIQEKQVYNLNAMLPNDIVVKKIVLVASDAHSRFDAINRTYNYFIYQVKNPFLKDHAWFYPVPLCIDLLNEAAAILKTYTDFTSFSKKKTQSKTKICRVTECFWQQKDERLVFTVTSNRFLRGMVRGLVGTMLLVGKKKITLEQFIQIIEAKNCSKADFTTPAHGLFLMKVHYCMEKNRIIDNGL